MLVPIARAQLTPTDVSSVLEPLNDGWLVQGPRVREFESKWSKFTSIENSIAVTSCTTGLHMALTALGVGPGDEVIVPAFTWISSANVVEHTGAEVVFCDVNLDTFNIDLTDAASKISAKTKAIIPVHLFGLAADMDEVMDLASSHDLFVIEDAACGFGAKYKGRHVGSFGDAGCFSFHPRKAITTGEGGMITTNSPHLSALLKKLRDHGADISDLQRHSGPRPYLLPDFSEAGFNFRMTDIQGALGSAQMDRAEEIVLERQALASRYREAFKDLSWLRTPGEHKDFEHGYQSFACLFEPSEVYEAVRRRDTRSIEKISGQRDKWMDSLQADGVSTRPATHAVHMLDFYRRKYGHAPEDFIGAYASYRCSISLPLFHGMLRAEQDFVIEKVLSYGGQ